ncbi:MAG: NAD(P)/FAD-dependent oxidoreductase [Haloarculaceae archaeon]
MSRQRSNEPVTVAVIGGGAVGVSLARSLAELGAAVTLYEAGDLASGASGRAAGICYDAFGDRRDVRLARDALAAFRSLSAASDRFAFVDRPYVWLARDGDDRRAARIREDAAGMRERGVAVEVLDGAALADRWPALVTGDVAVAAVADNAGYAEPAAYTRAVADRAEAAGATIRTDTPATLVGDGRTVRAGGTRRRFDAVAVAAGAHSRQVLAGVDLPVPVKPYRVQALVAGPADRTVPILYDATGGYYLRPDADGLLVGDGTEPIERDPDDWDREVDDRFRTACADYQRRAIGRAADPVRAWAGLCTATPDGDPLVGERAPGVFVACGFQGHGFMRAPAIGDRLAARILESEGDTREGEDRAVTGAGRGKTEPLRGFAPTRFDGDESFEIVEGMRIDGEDEREAGR